MDARCNEPHATDFINLRVKGAQNEQASLLVSASVATRLCRHGVSWRCLPLRRCMSFQKNLHCLAPGSACQPWKDSSMCPH